VRLFGGLLALLCAAALFWAAPAHAQTSVSQQIQVNGVIMPARYIIIDDQGEIRQILSNTSEAVQPTVYQNSIATHNQRSLTTELMDQYTGLLPTKTGAGILYEKPVSQPATTSIVRKASKSLGMESIVKQGGRILPVTIGKSRFDATRSLSTNVLLSNLSFRVVLFAVLR
jgi:hypothetical protein